MAKGQHGSNHHAGRLRPLIGSHLSHAGPCGLRRTTRSLGQERPELPFRIFRATNGPEFFQGNRGLRRFPNLLRQDAARLARSTLTPGPIVEVMDIFFM
jgi:hypothetical protein